MDEPKTDAEPKAEAKPEDGVPRAVKSARAVKTERGRKRNLHPSKRGHRCSTYGCNRSFLKMQELINHVTVHVKPTEFLKDKKFLCSMTGCEEALNSMQELMNHLKTHYKPNRYFKCENCMQHFRTHRSLFKHLHVCSDNGSNPAPLSMPPPPPSFDSKIASPVKPVKRRQSVIQCATKKPHFPTAPMTEGASTSSSSSIPDDLRPSMSSLASPTSNLFSALDTSLFAGRLPGPSSSSAAAGSYLPFLNPPAYNIPQTSVPQRLRPFLGNQSLPASNAVWKKNQGHATNSRILWEHTRDSYNCMQCTFSTASRDKMTKHIEGVHKNPPANKLQSEMNCDPDMLPFSTKDHLKMESSLIPQQ
ncbi:zinc finger protein 414 [Spea bombifrons]|uniref:zinc finger protein 414 n=1 Tax=Spea bombifrons TaxID=233779 RepID=UPI00234A80E1|nr:zinc finger protein 414 [Spea bombifrons]